MVTSNSQSLGLILGDQLSHKLATLRALDKQRDILLFAEVYEEASYVKHHSHKIRFIFSAMRHFAKELESDGWQVIYHSFDKASAISNLLQAIQHYSTPLNIDRLVVTQCGEHRLQAAIDHQWQTALGLPVLCLQDDRFICGTQEFQTWARGRKQLRMEYFYRDMRRKTGLLMDGDKPEGGDWNYDQQNRQSYKGEIPIPEILPFQYDDIDHAVFKLVADEFSDHPGASDEFCWGTTREHALQALEHFVSQKLRYFGDYQDAMTQQSDWLFHSLLSPYINVGLLDPLEVCQRAEQAYKAGNAPLNAVEGFIRQIIGWREYVRGVYWLHMPKYKQQNPRGNTQALPHYYWDGDTKMACMASALNNTLTHAYAHHIQRLMITGNFALLTEIAPQEVCEWYLAVYIDAFEWVELPNTLGMVMHCDGGVMGSKPYAASGKYIHKMSDHCKQCHYNVKTATDHDSCPFNALYWRFLYKQQEHFSKNPRMRMIYASWNKMAEDKQQAILARGDDLISTIEQL